MEALEIRHANWIERIFINQYELHVGIDPDGQYLVARNTPPYFMAVGKTKQEAISKAEDMVSYYIEFVRKKESNEEKLDNNSNSNKSQ